MQWQDLRVLVTGGAGMIGSALVRRLVKLKASVTIADNLWRGTIDNLCQSGEPLVDLNNSFHQVDLTDYHACIEVATAQDLVFHLADVVAGIDYVFGNQLSLFHQNVLMNTNMVHAAIASHVPDFIYVGTACSYPYDKQEVLGAPPFKEEDAFPANPESSYGWSKLMGEYECELAQKEDLLRVGILRLHNVFGPRTDLSPATSQVIPALIRKCIRYPQEPFVVWGSGMQRRAFVYVDDVVDSLVGLYEKGMNKGVIQIGPNTSTSISEIAEHLVEISGKDIPIVYDTSRPEGDVDRAADWSKAQETLGWHPTTPLRDGLHATYEWCKDKLVREGNAA